MKALIGNIISFQNDELKSLKGHALVWENEKIVDILPQGELVKKYPNIESEDLGEKLVLPGFIDCHLHFPQHDMIGCYGEELLGWLNKYTFPEEISFKSQEKASQVANELTDSLFANGTTTGVIYSSSDMNATKEMFRVADSKGLRAIIGKVAMDRNCPNELVVKPQDEYNQTKEILNEYMGKSKLLDYALTPRFAPTSTHELLKVIEKLKNEFPDLYLQTHYAETKNEINWVEELFPDNSSYLDVYNSYGLLGEKTLLGHGIHLSEDDLKCLADTKTKLVHCPSSNLFLGSGLFPYEKVLGAGIVVGLGSDIGAGTSLNIWKNLLNAYEIQKLLNHSIKPSELFKMATIDSARCLGKENTIGSIEVGKDLDIQVIDTNADVYLKKRFTSKKELEIEEVLFSLISFADERVVDSVYVAGKKVWSIS